MRKIEWKKSSELSEETKHMIWKALKIGIDEIDHSVPPPPTLDLIFYVTAKDVREAYITDPIEHGDPEFASMFDSFGLKKMTATYTIQLNPLEISSCKIVYEN